MNWGIKIIIALALFMTLIVSFGIYMVRSNTDTLETSDYYEQGLEYDSVYRRRQNLLRDAVKPVLSVAADTLTIQFAKAGNRGQLHLLRPSDQAQDRTLPLDVSGRYFRLPLATFASGLWQLQLEWESNGVWYQYEEQLLLDR